MANYSPRFVVDDNTLQSPSDSSVMLCESLTLEEIAKLLSGTSSMVSSAQIVTLTNPNISPEQNDQKKVLIAKHPNTGARPKRKSAPAKLTPDFSQTHSSILQSICPNLLTPEASPKVTPIRVKMYPPINVNPQEIPLSSPEVCVKTEQVAADPLGTLVFFDLETTGLGHIIGKCNVQITEISMVAIDRKEFWQSSNSELKDVRIIHKLSMCVRPRSAVSSGAAKITGLDNFNLIDQYPFDKNVANTIISFLSHLPKPVCLLAHNGNAFDFPLLRAEFKRLSIELPSDILIADTLNAFKSIGITESPSDRKICKSVKYGKNGRLSHSLENLHLFFFNKKPAGGHSSEGDCMALAKVCHKLKNEALPWIEAHVRKLDTIQPMW